MAESNKHREYIGYIQEKAYKLVPKDCRKLVLVDNESNPGNQIPSFTLEGYRPDIYYCHLNLLIIGEAKTMDDILTSHSKKQYNSYIKACEEFPGTSYLILATSWLSAPALNNHFRVQLQKSVKKLNIIVLDELTQIEENAKNKVN